MNTAKKKKKNTSITHPHYACSLGAAYTVSAIKNAVPIINCGPGCVDQQYFTMSFCNGFQGSVGIGGGDIPGTNSGEKEIVFGGAAKLDKAISGAVKIMNGDLYVVLTGCSPALVGDDVQSVVSRYQKQGIPIVNAEIPGFKGNNIYGHEVVVNSIIEQFVEKNYVKGEKQKNLVNLFFEIPYFNTFWRGDYEEIVRILQNSGFEVNILFGPESQGVKDWLNIPNAAFNLVISPWVGLSTAKLLEEKFDQPYLHIPVIPIGEEETTRFVRKVVEFSGIANTQSERFIQKEADKYYYYLDHFADFFAEYWFGFPSQFAVVADSAYNLAFTRFLSDQMGLIPVKQIITDNTPEAHKDNIKDIYHNITEGVDVDVQFIEDGYIAEQQIKDTDFGSGTPLIIGSSWERDVAKEKGAVLLEVGTITTEEVVINRSYVGYKGALSLIEQIYSSAVRENP